jgi:glyoxylase-like metal-dependent hydrolase (beta-lactamase superfamily II)
MKTQPVTVTGTAQHRAWRDHVLPPVERVRAGLWSLPTPFPDNPLRYVLSYLIETAKGPVLVDTGWPSPDAWDALVTGVRATGHEVGDVLAVLVTHFHPDHSGLAHRVREVSGAWIGMHEADARALAGLASPADFAAADQAWLTRVGVPTDELDGTRSPGLRGSSDLTAPDVLIADGDHPLGAATGLRAVWTPGHTPGHLCFADERHDVLLSGDHVLPRISPNISISPLSDDDDALGGYLKSLVRLATHEPDEVLPAHEYRFSGLIARVAQLQAHHNARLQEILEVIAAAPGATAFDVAVCLRWSRPWNQNRGVVRRSAIGETLAHLVHLERCGLITNTRDAGTAGADHWQIHSPAHIPYRTRSVDRSHP